MKSPENLTAAMKVFFGALSPRRRRQGMMAVILMFLGAGAEMLGISAVLAFLTLLTRPEKLTSLPQWQSFEQALGFHPNPILAATGLFIGVMLLSVVIRLALTWMTSSFAINTGMDLSAIAFKKVISQPYKFYIQTSSDVIISRFEKIAFTNNVITAGMQAVVASVVSLMIIIFLLLLDFTVAMTIGVVLVGSYVAVSVFCKQMLIGNSRIYSNAQLDRVGHVQQALGGVRDILLDRSQMVFQHAFERTTNSMRRPGVVFGFIQFAPRIIIEAIGMLVITLMALALAQRQGGLMTALPVLGGLAIGAQRLLPLLQQSYFGWSMFFSNREALLEVAALIMLPDAPHDAAETSTPFETVVALDHVSFAYVEDRYVLRDVRVSIAKGERVGIIGTTGSGKSTLTDLLLGLLEPSEGRILVDGTPLDQHTLSAWQAQVAHVPQSIYLSDDTVARNIAFGVPGDQVDMRLVASAARSAGLEEFILSQPEGYDARCGERGIRLSGGQRQRIGIARALYKRARILILDEATSALDNETERSVMESIAGLSTDITIIMIAHRLTSLADCGRIFRVEHGLVTEIPQSELGVAKAAGAGGKA